MIRIHVPLIHRHSLFVFFSSILNPTQAQYVKNRRKKTKKRNRKKKDDEEEEFREECQYYTIHAFTLLCGLKWIDIEIFLRIASCMRMEGVELRLSPECEARW